LNPIIYIVDDDPSVRHGLTTLMEVSGFAVETFDCGESMLKRNPLDFGCILLDVRMPGMDGLQVQEALRKQNNPLPIIFLTAFGDVSRIVRAVKDGAEDYFIKPVDGGILVNRVQQVLADFALELKKERDQNNFDTNLKDLTEREHEVLLLSLEGLSCKDIGLKLGVSHRTVELHRSHICAKTGMANFTELFRLASKFGKAPN
jgi:FixJ family two-component response regulator